MRILDRLPVAAEDGFGFVGAERVRFKADQIIVWVSLTTETDDRWNPNARPFPAILDTGHTHNFAIRNQHLARWAGVPSESMKRLGHIRHRDMKLPLRAANVWLHFNKPKSMLMLDQEPILLKMDHGIAAYPDAAEYPRLPLLGLRALLSNKLHLTVDSESRSVTLRTADWRTRVLTWLA